METRREQTIEEIIENKLAGEDLKQFKRIYYGREDHSTLEIKESTLKTAADYQFQVQAYAFDATKEEMRQSRLVKVGLVQHSIVLPTHEPIDEQRNAIFRKVEKITETAVSEGVQIICLQETWPMPFFLCTKQKERWSSFAEPATDGPSTKHLSALAKKHGIVIISPILEEDEGVWWNTAVVINEEGVVMGKHRKNHLPSVGSFSETAFYSPGNMGHPVFKTKFGNIAINICYGRHQALNWLMFGLNGAEIVFNPSATISEFGESFWTIEARNAAVANSYFTCSINRVGTEEFTVEKSKITRSYYGSSHVTAPNGCRTPVMSRSMDGLLIVEMDLNLCRQVKERWGFNMTARLDMYAKELNEVCNKNKWGENTELMSEAPTQQ